MVIKIEDLQVGDEILVGSNSRFRWFKVVRPVKLKKGSTDRYSAVKCSTKANITKTPVYKWVNGSYSTQVLKYRTIKDYECTGLDHNIEEYVNLNYKQAWLIARNGQRI